MDALLAKLRCANMIPVCVSNKEDYLYVRFISCKGALKFAKCVSKSHRNTLRFTLANHTNKIGWVEFVLSYDKTVSATVCILRRLANDVICDLKTPQGPTMPNVAECPTRDILTRQASAVAGYDSILLLEFLRVTYQVAPCCMEKNRLMQLIFEVHLVDGGAGRLCTLQSDYHRHALWEEGRLFLANDGLQPGNVQATHALLTKIICVTAINGQLHVVISKIKAEYGQDIAVCIAEKITNVII